MYFFLHVLPEVVSAVFSFLVEWFLFQEQPTLYGGTLSPLVTAWLYMAMMLAVWLLPIFYDACRRKGGMISTALNHALVHASLLRCQKHSRRIF